MAILFDEKSIKLGHVDGCVFRRMNGKIVMQSMPSQYRDANSPAQQKQRRGMCNILAYYRLLKNIIHGQFAEVGGRTYNNFVSSNLKLDAVELSKEDYKKGYCILAPYIISKGTLPPLEAQAVDNHIEVQIKGEDWQYGDILRFIKVTKKESSDNPFLMVANYDERIIYNAKDQTIVTQELPHGAYAFVHVRCKGEDNTKVSTEHLVIV